MRDIKFRVFDKTKEEMLYLASNQTSEIHLQMNNSHWSVFDGTKRLCGSADATGVLMQFTGMFDKYQKEIYEGDVLKTYAILARDHIASEPFTVQVKFSESCWLSNGILGKLQTSISEIVANIYQQPTTNN